MRQQESQRDSGWAGQQAPLARATSPVTGRSVVGFEGLDRSSILALQRSVGNTAVNRLLQRCGPRGCRCGGVCGESLGRELQPEDDLRAGANRAGRLLARDLNRMVGRTSTEPLEFDAGKPCACRSSSVASQLQRDEVEIEVPSEVCAAGEIGGQVYMCCHPNPYRTVAACEELRKRIYDECWDDSAKDVQALETCSNESDFANCHCLERHTKGMCTCGGLV